MNKLYLIILVPFFIFLSCDKDSILENGTVNGFVRDKTTDQGIDGATVYLLSHVPSGGFGGGGGSTQIDFTTSNADGSFSFQFDYDKDLAYTCAATHDLYFDYGDEFPILEEITEGENVEVNLQPKAWLSIYIKDTEPFLTGFELRLWPFSYSMALNAFNLDTIIFGSVAGNYNREFVWVLDDYFSDELFVDSVSVYCPAFDTSYVEIFY